MENLIVSIRVLAGAFTFMLFVVVAVLADAEPHVLLFGGLLTWCLGYVIGLVMANILQQINAENQFHPVERNEDHARDIGQNVDVLQNIEMPASR